MRWTTEHDDLRRAARFRYRKARETDWSRALNHNVVTHADADAFDAVKRSGQSTTRADDCFRRQRFRDFEDRCAGPEVNVIGIAAEQMRRDAAIVRDAVSFTFETARGLGFDAAVITLAAVDRRAPRDAIAGGE